MKSALILAAIAASLSAESICGKRYTTDGFKVEVYCMDLSPLAQYLPATASTALRQTQVFIESTRGAAVKVALGEQTQLGELRNVGPLKALVSFEGIGHTELPKITLLVEAQ